MQVLVFSASSSIYENFLDYCKSKKKIKFLNSYKDFISFNQFIRAMNKIIREDIFGVYNLSLGNKIYVNELIGWLNTYNKIQLPLQFYLVQHMQQSKNYEQR